MPTITTHSYCVVKDNDFAVGDKMDVVSHFVSWRIDADRQLWYKIKGRIEVKGFFYGEDWTHTDMIKDAIDFLFNKLKKTPGYKVFRNIGL
jgi:hypothetical protein